MTSMHLLLLLAAVLSSVIERVEQRGPVTATVRLEPEQPLIGDVVTFTIEVVAEPDVEILMPEFGEALDRYTILDFVPRDEITDDGKTQSVQTYRLQPATSGSQSIPPILIEFVDRRAGQRPAPEGEDAFELLTPRIDFEVQSVLPKSATVEMAPPLGELPPRGPSPLKQAAWWLVILLLLGLVTTPFLLAAWRKRRTVIRRRSAYEIARSRLDRLMSGPIPDSSAIDDFIVELSDIIRRYLEDRFDLRAELTTEEFLEVVSGSRQLATEHRPLLRDFLKQADLVKFAGIKPSDDDVHRMLAAADRFLTETREPSEPLDAATPAASRAEQRSLSSKNVSSSHERESTDV